MSLDAAAPLRPRRASAAKVNYAALDGGPDDPDALLSSKDSDDEEAEVNLDGDAEADGESDAEQDARNAKPVGAKAARKSGAKREPKPVDPVKESKKRLKAALNSLPLIPPPVIEDSVAQLPWLHVPLASTPGQHLDVYTLRPPAGCKDWAFVSNDSFYTINCKALSERAGFNTYTYYKTETWCGCHAQVKHGMFVHPAVKEMVDAKREWEEAEKKRLEHNRKLKAKVLEQERMARGGPSDAELAVIKEREKAIKRERKKEEKRRQREEEYMAYWSM